MRIVGGIVGGGFSACAAKPFRMMVARDGVEPPTPAFSGLDTASLSPFLVNYLTCRGGHSFVTTL